MYLRPVRYSPRVRTIHAKIESPWWTCRMCARVESECGSQRRATCGDSETIKGQAGGGGVVGCRLRVSGAVG